MTPEAHLWEGAIEAEELIFTDAESHDPYQAEFVDANRRLCDGRRQVLRREPILRRVVRRLRARVSVL